MTARRKKAPARKTEEKTRTDRIEIGADAQRLMADPMLSTVLENIKEDMLEGIIQSESPEMTWRYKQLYGSAVAFSRYLDAYIVAGRDAANLLMQKQEAELDKDKPEFLDPAHFRKLALQARIDYERENGGPQ